MQDDDTWIGRDKERTTAASTCLGDGRHSDVHDERIDEGKIVGLSRIVLPRKSETVSERSQERCLWTPVQQVLVKVHLEVACPEVGSEVGEDGRDRAHLGDQLEVDVTEMGVGKDDIGRVCTENDIAELNATWGDNVAQ